MDPLWIIVGFLIGSSLGWVLLFFFDKPIFRTLDKLYDNLPWNRDS